jgi:hypothetical protein
VRDYVHLIIVQIKLNVTAVASSLADFRCFRAGPFNFNGVVMPRVVGAAPPLIIMMVLSRRSSWEERRKNWRHETGSHQSY